MPHRLLLALFAAGTVLAAWPPPQSARAGDKAPDRAGGAAPDLSRFPKLTGTLKHQMGSLISFVPPTPGESFTLDLAKLDDLGKRGSLEFGPGGKSYITLPGPVTVAAVHYSGNGAVSGMRLVSDAPAPRKGRVVIDVWPVPGRNRGPNAVEAWVVSETDGLVRGVALLEGEADGSFPKKPAGAGGPPPEKNPATPEMREAIGRVQKVHAGLPQREIDEAVEALHTEMSRRPPEVFVPEAVPHLLRLARTDTRTRTVLRQALAKGWVGEELARAYLVQAGDTPGPHVEKLVNTLGDNDAKVRERAIDALGACGAAAAPALPKLRQIVTDAKADPTDFERAYTLKSPAPEHVRARWAVDRIEGALAAKLPPPLREPAYRTTDPRYCRLAFGPAADRVVWLVIDGEDLYVDRNGNGDLTEAGERVGRKSMLQGGGFEVPELTLGGAGAYSNLVVYWTPRATARHAPDYAVEVLVEVSKRYVQYAAFRAAAGPPAAAPVLHFGGPLEAVLLGDHPPPAPGAEAEVRAGVGTRSATGHLALVRHDRQPAPPADAHPTAEVSFPRGAGAGPAVVKFALDQRCCNVRFYGTFRAPAAAGPGTPTVTLSFPGWAGVAVGPTTRELVAAPAPAGR